MFSLEKNSLSQTKKKRYERFQDIENDFVLLEHSSLEGEHILLVDDISTTGATLYVCIQKLLVIREIKISVICVAN